MNLEAIYIKFSNIHAHKEPEQHQTQSTRLLGRKKCAHNPFFFRLLHTKCFLPLVHCGGATYHFPFARPHKLAYYKLLITKLCYCLLTDGVSHVGSDLLRPLGTVFYTIWSTRFTTGGDTDDRNSNSQVDTAPEANVSENSSLHCWQHT